MLEVDLIVQPSNEARFGAATDRYLLRAVGEGRRPVLRVSELRGRVLSLGRYHFAPEHVAESGVEVTRRLCGGRVQAAGEGFRAVSLFLPHRSALVSPDPFALSPSQVLNRFVRGLLHGCREVGIPAYYPGRDLVTVGRSILAMISFECDARGSTLLEAHIATAGELATVVDLLQTADPQGVVTAEHWAPESTTSMERQLGRTVDIEEMAALWCRGYESQFSISFRRHAFSSTEANAIQIDAESGAEAWVASRRPRPGMDRHAVSPVQVGVLEAWYSLDARNRIDSIVFAGDFIANSPAVQVLERQLHGCPLQPDAIDRVVNGVFDDRANFLLGIGKLDAISRLLAPASGA